MAGRDKSASRRPPEPKSSCADYVDTTALMSPKPPAKKLKAGHILDLILQPSRDGRSTVVAVNSSREIVGSIASARTPELIKCMERKFVYQAEIVKADGGHYTVDIRIKS